MKWKNKRKASQLTMRRTRKRGVAGLLAKADAGIGYFWRNVVSFVGLGVFLASSLLFLDESRAKQISSEVAENQQMPGTATHQSDTSVADSPPTTSSPPKAPIDAANTQGPAASSPPLTENLEQQIQQTLHDEMQSTEQPPVMKRPLTQRYLGHSTSEVIILDPGHGGEDPGTIGNGLHEKNIAMSISTKVADLLKKEGQEVIMTRDNDKKITLSERVRHTFQHRKGLFVSVHLNACAESSSVNGIETFYFDKTELQADATLANNGQPADGTPGIEAEAKKLQAWLGSLWNHTDRSRQLAAQIQNNLAQTAGCRDRGVKHGNFYVLRESGMPSVLIECGFVSNAHEATRLRQDAHQTRIAQAITNGIVSYLEEQKKRPAQSTTDVAF